MKKQVRVRPGKGQSAVGAVVGAVFVLLGIFMVIPAFGPFGIFWTLIAAVITAVNLPVDGGCAGAVTGGMQGEIA